MTPVLSPEDAGKYAAAMASVALVQDSMRLGLGTGSTAAWMVRALAQRARDEALDLICVPTSARTADLASRLGLRVADLDDLRRLDMTIDGADEFDPHFRLIKGGGGAHLREKIVAAASERMVVITDPSKEVTRLGAFPLPIEVVPFGLAATRGAVDGALADAEVETTRVTLRHAGDVPFRTDEGNFVLDAHLAAIGDPAALDAALVALPGVVETGLFIGLCDTVIVGHSDGRAETLSGAERSVAQVDLAGAASLMESEAQ